MTVISSGTSELEEAVEIGCCVISLVGLVLD